MTLKLPTPLRNAYGDPLWVVCVYPTFTQVYNNTNGGDMYYDYTGGQMMTLNIRRYGGIVNAKIEYDNMAEKTKKLKKEIKELMKIDHNVSDLLDVFEYIKKMCRTISSVDYPMGCDIYLSKILKVVDEVIMRLCAQTK